MDPLQWMGAVRMRVQRESKQSKTALNKYVGAFWYERTTGDGLLHCRKRYYGLWTHGSQKHLDGFVFTNVQPLASQYVNWWTGVVYTTCGLLWCFYQLFGLSFWWHPFTAEDPLLSKWCNAIFLQVWWRRNKLIYILDGLSCFNYYY